MTTRQPLKGAGARSAMPDTLAALLTLVFLAA